MPALIVMLLGGLIRIAGTMAGRVLISLGIGVATYTGFSAGLAAIKSQALSAIGGLPPEVIGIMGLLKVGVCISIITSAVAARMVIQGLQGDSIKRWVLK